MQEKREEFCKSCNYKFEIKEKHQIPDIVCPKCGLLINDESNVNKIIKQFSELPDSNFKLKYCSICVQMTNHLNSICQKCKERKYQRDNNN